MTAAVRQRWCLLIHSLPARPLYLRARVRRRLAEAGAALLKPSVYILPWSEEGSARLRAVAAEIESAGASAFVCEATFPDAGAEPALIAACNRERGAQYRAWIAEASTLPDAVRGAGLPSVTRLAARLASLRALDRFGAPGAKEAVAILARLERAPGTHVRRGADLVGLRWVTRKGLHVDRLACAWVVRRFIDPAARFRFVMSPEAPIAADEIGFDMPGAAITHVEGRCSVEALVRRAGIRDPGVRRIAEIVHDLDIKDGRHGHPETAGFEQLLVGTLVSLPRDEDRLARGLELFDALYAAHGSPVTAPRLPASAPRVRIPAGLGRRRGR